MMKRSTFLFLSAVTLAASVRAGAGQPFITEFMAKNQGTLLDEDGESSDWLELYNPGDAAVDLEGWFLTDDAKKLDKWRFPKVSLGAQKFLGVFASEKNRSDPSRNRHTNFGLLSSGYLALTDPHGVVASHFGPSYPLQVGGASFGAVMDSNSTFMVPANAPAKTLVPLD